MKKCVCLCVCVCVCVQAFFSVVNWAQVSDNYEKYASKGLPVPV